MEGDGKKRKMVYEEEDEEEEKIQKFFALIKSTRQVRHLLRESSKWPNEGRDHNKKEEDQEKPTGTGAWKPEFQPEDFLEQDDKRAGHGACPSEIQEEKKEDKGGDGLDLKLSL